ncbi:MAG: hypothetical protein FJZ12_01290 [Candidatus Omnitrophica bacterium]|nr:hypothetical protein [Candidatus Omnitrophota bacterium]
MRRVFCILILILSAFGHGEALAIANKGEKIIYNISPVGKAEYNDLGIVEYKGKEYWLVTLETSVPGFKDLEKIYADPVTGLPLVVERFIKWPLSEEYIVEEYDPKNYSQVNRRYVKDKLTNEYKYKSDNGPYHNAVLLPFYLRGIQDLKIGWSMVIRVPEEFTVTLSEIADVNVKGKQIKAYHFTSKPDKFNIWISYDADRVPAVIKGSGYGMVMQSRFADIKVAEAVGKPEIPPSYLSKEAEEVVSLVKDAASLVTKKGKAAFSEFKKEDSKWRFKDNYIFVLDTEGNMILHPDPQLEGKNKIELKDVNNKPVIKGLIEAADRDKKEGWFHYQWPQPGNIFPLWKSSFVVLVKAPTGKKYIIGSGKYNMKTEKAFIVDAVESAVSLIEQEGEVVFPKFRDKAGKFLFKDVYIFVDRPDGIELVNGAFPNLEGKNFLDYRDSRGKRVGREYINLALTKGSGWVEYYWPKPQEALPSKKHAYVKKATFQDKVYIVGSGVYAE